jgi:glucose-1-phosphate cytidylyltransferase
MKVVILCGGLGTRLREETEVKPKPMVEVGGRPILWHIMKSYAAQGFTDFVLCLGYKGEKIKEYFLNYEAMNSDFTLRLGAPDRIEYHRHHGERDWTITLADTGATALTGARVARIERFIEGEEFLLTYGDGLCDIDLQALLAFHRAHGKTATVTGVRPPSRFGELIVDGSKVLDFSEKPRATAGHINGGFFVFKRAFFKYLSTDDGCMLEKAPLESCAQDGQLEMFAHDGFWQCMDTFRDMQVLQKEWDSGRAPWKKWAD